MVTALDSVKPYVLMQPSQIQPDNDLRRHREAIKLDLRERYVEQKHIEAHELQRLIDTQRLTRDWTYDQIRTQKAATGLIVDIEV
jgi:hypothetical protein